MALERRKVLRACWSFHGTSLPTRAFLVARMSIIPLAALDDEFRSLSGSVLSVGCGHGVLERYLISINPDVTVTGVELDEARVRAAAASADRAPRVEVRRGDATEPAGDQAFDAAVAVDVLHHVPFEQQPEVARSLFRSVRPGGICLIKDMDVRPRWKFHWNRLHDKFVNRSVIYCRSPKEMAGLFADAGFSIESSEHVDRPYGPYPQYLLRLRKT